MKEALLPLEHGTGSTSTDPPIVAVAYSGGRDSTALLHATTEAAERQGIGVLALHVHHGLSRLADDWLAHCEAQCRRWRGEGRAVDFIGHRLCSRPMGGDSVEAWARRERYRALAAMALAHGATVVLLAHHRQDQAETWLLQALRGGGTAGLASMPSSACRDGLLWLRPWLHRSRSDLDGYIQRHRLSHVDDDSNADSRFARNRLRLQVWPALTAAFPEAEAAMAQAAIWSQQADAALAELAELDLARVADWTGLTIERWLELSDARRSNLLRAWLARGTDCRFAATLIVRLMAELPQARSGRWPADGGELRLYRGVLRLFAEAAEASAARPKEAFLRIGGAGTYALPGWGGSLGVRAVREGGVPLAWLGHVELRARTGGEKFRAATDRPSRSLKKQFQNAGVASWDRDGPLVYSGGQLVYVPGLGLDAGVIGPPGETTVELQWQRF